MCVLAALRCRLRSRLATTLCTSVAASCRSLQVLSMPASQQYACELRLMYCQESASGRGMQNAQAL